MPHQTTEAGQCGTFHFEIGNLITVVFELLDFFVLMRVCQGNTQFTSLRTEETAGGDGDASYHIISRYTVYQFGIGINYVRGGSTHVSRPSHVVEESAFKGQVANCITSGIEVQQAVETNGFGRTYKSSYGRVRLQTATRTDTDQFQLTQLGLFLSRLEVDVSECVQFVHNNINVIATDTSGNNGDSFTFISTCNCLEFAALHFTFFILEM